jgi:hypothetical protein
MDEVMYVTVAAAEAPATPPPSEDVVERVLTSIARSVVAFGQNAYYDAPQGALIDYDLHVAALRSDPQAAATVKRLLSRGRGRGMAENAERFVRAALVDLQDLPSDRWDALMADPEIAELF